jgi:signal transduction histidine kinase
MTDSPSSKAREYPANYYASLLAGLVHKLNNMITVLTGHTGLLLLEPTLPEEVTQPVRRISRASEMLSKLIDAASSVSKAPTLVLEPIVVSEFLATLAPPFGLKIQKKCSESLALLGDRLRLKNVFEQILENSTDANANFELITVTREKSLVFLRFRDNGHGIKSEVITRIFDPFFTTRTQQGRYGLGLFRARGDLARMSGEISADSDGETYTEISVGMPAA